MRRGSGFEPNRLRGVGAACMVALLVLVVGAASAIAGGILSKAAARQAAMTEVRSFVKSHSWADAGRLGKCGRRSSSRVACDGVVRGKQKSCAVEVLVRAGGGDPAARLKRGKCHTAAPNRVIRLAASIDPNPIHLASSPFQVIYTFGASATTEVPGQADSSKPFPPPAGVLSFYSDGQLECTVKVTKSNPTSTCVVDYASLGAHNLKATYKVGSKSASTGMTYVAQPFGTSFSISSTFKPAPTAGAYFPACPAGEPCEIEAGLKEEMEIEIGTLEVKASKVSPWGTLPIPSCPGEDTHCKLLPLEADGTQKFQVWVIADLLVNSTEMREEGELLDAEMGAPKSVEVVGAPGMTGIAVEEIEAGAFYFHTETGTRPGFTPFQVTTPIQFIPAAIDPVRLW